jgi:protein arginine kinase
VLERSRDAAARTSLLGEGTALRDDGARAGSRRLLLERHLVSKELIGEDDGGAPSHGAAAHPGDDSLSVMVNEEDHLRLQSLVSGFRLREAWRRSTSWTRSSRHLRYAFHTEFGYLTSCPTNVGTGLRASVLVHLPGLVLTQEIAKVLQGIAQVGLTFRGLYGEGSEVVGNFFQISNQTTLGKTRGGPDRPPAEDRAAGDPVRAAGAGRPAPRRPHRDRGQGLARLRPAALRPVHLLRGGDEPPERRSAGRGAETSPGLSVYTLNQIMIFTQSAHLDQMAGRSLSKSEADIFRATYIRRILAQEGPPVQEDDGRAGGSSGPN